MQRKFTKPSLVLTLIGGVLITLWFILGGEQSLSTAKIWLEKYHWWLTVLRVLGFAGIITWLYHSELKQHEIDESLNPAALTLRQLTQTRTFRLAIWLCVLELVLGQGLIAKLVAILFH
ncbi:MAG: hypothetical protein OXO49_01855 [Gammaproteobacteria bacterium]|nr:hypothetical protein [Gammaproteobacteria bacterium]MDE0252703.1 hypothetical protein [Gammaproteobacteria bacterium]MDE0402391.1 hypothetical protein [Gammaproteobacteria bacterium]